ncbi:hypothetical protein Mal35_26500 [Gimesia maris]|uniref:hypothetical protein n=1 Tax=Gimesia maris TaxID=122 RepID=UPI00118A2448|nr:hypothetical protein [Gimesia maris]QDT79195.1 hypothetical protein Mal35_26500 [Gimesia maris]
MAKKRRKIEVHRLVISGLVDGTDYNEFLYTIWQHFDGPLDAVFKSGSKCHCLEDMYMLDDALCVRFFSYSEGDRPPVVNTSSMDISPNPLEEDETFITWTHMVSGKAKKRNALIIERVQTGIWPTKIQEYLQWMIDEFVSEESLSDYQASEREPITVSIEPDPDASFMRKVMSLDRITSATVRIVRPNPGWKDLDDALSGEADESDAHYADVKMNARRNSSLSKNKGIIKEMERLDDQDKLGRAVVEGRKGEVTEKFSSERIVRHKYESLPVDIDGKIQSDESFRKFIEFLHTQK